MKKLVLGVALLASATAFAAPAAPQISHSRLNCVGVGANAKVIAKIANANSARVYFSAQNGSEYYVEMLQRGTNEFWTVLPIADMKTSAINYRIVAKGEGNAQMSTPAVSVPVEANCASFSLTRDEKRFATNLVIGQTVTAVDALEGFDCYGVVSTITASGEMRSYNECDARGTAQVAAANTTKANGQLAPVAHAPGAGTNLSVVQYNHGNEIDPISDILP
jgi:hypothetical protein